MIRIYSVGHSNHSLDDFLGLLREHEIELVVDVRSSPYSRYVPHANRESLQQALEETGIAYRWEGGRLGGKPEGEIPDYGRMAARPAFQQGVTELVSLAGKRRTAIMCSEGDHRKCHRYKLITPALLKLDVDVLHIQPDGELVDESKEPRQLSLF
jgi:uncharacterized protein (DUF488 family)